MSTELASVFSYFFIIFTFPLLVVLTRAVAQGQILTGKAGISAGGN